MRRRARRLLPAAVALALGAMTINALGCEGGKEGTGTTTSPTPTTTPTGESTPTEPQHEPTSHPAPVPQPPPSTPSGCGVERWAIKTMRDPNASAVNLTPVSSSVEALDAIAAPHEPTERVEPTETTVYEVTGVIEFVKSENDHDRHLVLVDGSGHTMIVESADPACAPGSDVLPPIEAVRKAVDERFPSDASSTSVPVTVTGIGFFDRVHGQTGVAPNGIELHPLLSIGFLSKTAATAVRAPRLHLRESHAQD